MVEPQDQGWILDVIEQLRLNEAPASYHRHCTKKNGQEAWINVGMGRIADSNGQEVIQAVFTVSQSDASGKGPGTGANFRKPGPADSDLYGVPLDHEH